MIATISFGGRGNEKVMAKVNSDSCMPETTPSSEQSSGLTRRDLLGRVLLGLTATTAVGAWAYRAPHIRNMLGSIGHARKMSRAIAEKDLIGR